MLKLNRFVLSRNFSGISQLLLQQAKTSEVPRDKSVVYHEQYKLNYKRLQLNDKQLAQLMLLTKSKKKRTQEQQIIIEGQQLLAEAVQSHLKLNHILFSHVEKLEKLINILGTSTAHINFFKVPQQDLTFWSVLTTCPGVIGIFDKPEIIKPKPNSLPITVICDNLREPNNVGAVIRLSNALPATKVILPRGCADQWETKAIRGSSGSVFYMPTEDSLSWHQIDQSISSGEETIVLIADNDTTKYHERDVIDYDKIPDEIIAGREIVVIMGGETHGIGEEAKNFTSKRNWRVINIPLDSTVNSLNTSNALAIVLFELRRKLSTLQ